MGGVLGTCILNSSFPTLLQFYFVSCIKTYHCFVSIQSFPFLLLTIFLPRAQEYNHSLNSRSP